MGAVSPKHILAVGLAALAFVLIGTIVGLLVSSSGSGSSSSVRNIMLQADDLPPYVVRTEEKFYSREELMRLLPAESQVFEAGLQAAARAAYESRDGSPIVIEVWVYLYKNEDAAETAHTYLREWDWNRLFSRVMKRIDWYALNLNGSLIEGVGEDAFSITGEAAPDADSGMFLYLYFIHEGNARAQVLVTSSTPLIEDPDDVARKQFLRLERPEAVDAP